ncbi:MAG: hypothetical protein KDB03_13845 [Planctomycetales bacterium]|nr:hypothetical protein [Planctomycetales bacterium]
MSQKSILNLFIILSVVALVAVPVIVGGYRAELARWYIAAAINAVEIYGESGEKEIQRALEWDSQIEMDPAYLHFRLSEMKMKGSPTDALVKFVGKLDPHKSSDRSLFLDVQSLLYERKEYWIEVEVIESFLLPEDRESATNLNLLAYLRALCARELDTALQDIDKALSIAPDDPNLLDTRAWVHFQAGNPSKALDDSQRAVELYVTLISDWDSFLTSQKQLLDRFRQEHASKTEEFLVSESQIHRVLWAYGVLRYHRAKILETLGRIDEAQADLDWLKDWHLPTDGTLQ